MADGPSRPAAAAVRDVEQPTDAVVRRVRPRLLAGVLAMVAGAVPVVVLGLLVRDTAATVARFDQRVEVQLTGLALAHDAVRRAAEVGAGVLHPFVFRLAVVGVAVWLARRGAMAACLWAVATMLTGTLLGVVLKALVQRARPVLDQPVAAVSGSSFPSGHALNAALGVTVLLVVLWPPIARRRARTVAAAAGALLVVLTCLDRLLLGVHFPSDVVAGTLVGCLLPLSSWVAFGPVVRERASRHEGRAAPAGRPRGTGAVLS